MFLIVTPLLAHLPKWADEQIVGEISHFAPFSAEDVITSYRAVQNEFCGLEANICLVTIKGGEVTFTPPSARTQFKALEGIVKRHGLDDTQFLLTKLCERPLFLQHLSVPIFTLSKKKTNTQALLVPRELFDPIPASKDTIPWERKIDRALFVGLVSRSIDNYYEWSFHPRCRLLLLKERLYPSVDGHFSLSERHHQTSYHIKTALEECHVTGPFIPPAEQGRYRFLLALDGDAAPRSLSWQLLSHSCPLVQESPYMSWISRGLKPNVHVVSFAADLMDLESQIAHLRAHPDLAQQVAEEGRLFAKEIFKQEVMEEYFVKLLRNYSLLLIK